MNNFEFFSPTKVIFGRDIVDGIGEELKRWNATKVLIHYGGGSVVKSGLLPKVESAIKSAGISFVGLGGVKPNPRLSLVQEGIDLCRKEGVDFILGVGGGSVIDSCKAIALGVPYDGDVWDFYSGAMPTVALPHGNIVTLAAAGSETSISSVITKEEGMLKRSNNTQLSRPRFTLMDPEQLYSLPPYQTGCGIVDILMHTIERYFPSHGTNEITDRIAEALMRTVIQYGPVCMKDPKNYEARSEIFWAGSLSHNTLTGLGGKGDWACHQIEHELGGKYDVAHGAGLSAVWPAWARYVYKQDVMRFARFGVHVWGLNMNFQNPEETALAAIDATETFFRSIAMPVTISELMPEVTVQPADLEEMAEKCAFFGERLVGNVKQLNKEDVLAILKASL